MRADRTMMLTRNMLAAIQTFRLQQALLAVITIVGPVTTKELAGWCRYRLPVVSRRTLQRRLTQLRKARALKTYAIPGDAAGAVVWAVPGQAKPKNLGERRRRAEPVIVDRRQVGPTESWWAQPSREAFVKAREQRWS